MAAFAADQETAAAAEKAKQEAEAAAAATATAAAAAKSEEEAAKAAAAEAVAEAATEAAKPRLTAVFEAEGSLGITWAKDGSSESATIKEIMPAAYKYSKDGKYHEKSDASVTSFLAVGMVLDAVNGESLAKNAFQEVLETIMAAGRPLELTFLADENESGPAAAAEPEKVPPPLDLSHADLSHAEALTAASKMEVECPEGVMSGE